MKQPATPEGAPTQPLAQLSNDDPVDTATLELLASWRLQDATDNPDELRAAEQELAEFKRAMNDFADDRQKHPVSAKPDGPENRFCRSRKPAMANLAPIH